MRFDAPYAITRRLAQTDLEAARARVTAALGAEGFGVLTEIDVQKTLKAKLGVDRPPYVILGACNPKLADAALEHDPSVGLLLPCNVVLAKDGEDVVVSAASPRAMFSVGGGDPSVAEVADEAEARIRRAVDAL